MPEPSKEQIEAAREWLNPSDNSHDERRGNVNDLAALLAEREAAAYRRGIEDAAQIVKNNGARRHTLMRDIRSLVPPEN